jgi:hypothetical protein
MATIVTRAGKGSPLTNTEVDANFTNINTELGTKANSSALSSYLPLTGGTLTGNLSMNAGATNTITLGLTSVVNEPRIRLANTQWTTGVDLAASSTTKGYGFFSRDRSAWDLQIDGTNGNAIVAGALSAGGSVTVGNALYLRGDMGVLNAAQNAWNSVVVRNGGDNWIVYGGTGGVRAPIFYDTDNTVYYIDPTGTSNLAGLTVNGGSVYRDDWTSSRMSQSDFVDGTLVTTDIPATAQDGDSFIIEITGKSYSDSNPPFKVIAQGYLYNNGILSKSGISYGGDFATSMKVFEDGGVLKFWWPRISYWNSFEVRVLAMNAPSNGTITRNRVTAIANSTEPTGTKKVTINVVRSLREDTWINNKYFGSNGAIYGTQFADANNSAYYVDPAGSSALNAVYMASLYNPNGGLVLDMNGADYTLLRGPDGAIRFYVGRSALPTYYDNESHQFRGNGGSVYMMSISGSGTVMANADFRAPIFYDLNDTSRYVDATATSMLGDAVMSGSLTVGNGAAASYIYMGDADAGTRILHCNSDRVGFLTQAGGWGAYCSDNGDWTTENIGWATASFRAQVFYDSNDSAYFTDPAATSNLNALTLGGRPTTEAVYYQGFTLDANTMANNATGFTYSVNAPFTGPIIRVGNTSYSLQFSAQYNQDGRLAFRTRNGDNGTFNTWRYPAVYDVNSNGGGLLFATIYYDSLNTAYYLDPLSTSVLNNVRAATIESTNGFTAINLTSSTYNILNDPSGRNAVLLGSGDPANYYDNDGHFFRSRSAAASLAYITGSGVFAPMFYDITNTAYFLDAANGDVALSVVGRILGGFGATSTSGTTDWNHISNVRSGSGATLLLGSATNGPAGGQYFHPFNFEYSSKDGSGNVTQFAIPYSSPANRMLMRGRYDGVWGGWVDFLTSDTGDQTKNGVLFSTASFRAPIFYDSNNSGYYVDANNNTNLYSLTLSGGTYFQPNSWIQFNGQYGLYWPNNNGAHIEANVSSSYGQLGLRGSRNNYGGIYDAHSGVNGIMYDGAGNGGVYREANGRWYFYHNVANNCTSFGTSTTVSGYDIYAATGIYSGGRVDGTIFYDSNNTGYYTDPNGTSRVNLINADTLRSYSNIYTDANYGFGLVGVYSAVRYQGVFAMGDSYKLAADGTTTGSLYGIAWSHPNAGGVASNLNTHGALIMENGTFLAALSGSIRCRDDMRAPLFYDRDNSAYYTDPAGTSVLATVNFGSNPNTGGGGGRIVPSVGSPYSIRQEFGSDNSGWRYGVAKNVGGTVTVLFYVQDSGDCVATGNLTAYSDIRVKDNIETVGNALHKLAAIRGVTYTRTDLDDKERRYAGVIAQELEQVLPEAVGGDEHTKTVDYNGTIALLIQAVKELKAKVEVLEAKTCH